MRRSIVLVMSVCLAGCGDDDVGSVDAAIMSMDATGTRDAGDSDAGVDAGTVCSPACGVGRFCCSVGGAPTCVDINSDPAHCGDCDVDCSTGRGTECRFGMCVCGIVDIGCVGSRMSTCCPAQTPAGMPYCANLESDGDDCGACGRECDLATGDRCSAGRCQCGLTGRACTGAADDVCCIDAIVHDANCVNTVTDRINCGSCNNRCQTGEPCTAGSCMRGTATCTTPCAFGEVCCNGACCTRTECDRGMC